MCEFAGSQFLIRGVCGAGHGARPGWRGGGESEIGQSFAEAHFVAEPCSKQQEGTLGQLLVQTCPNLLISFILIFIKEFYLL